MTLPTISVVMPVLNCGNTLEKAIQSVLAQNYPKLQIIIFDGGSTDNTLEILKRYADHLTFWRSQKDGSPTAATNDGINMATGDLVAILMGDDWYEPGLFNRIGGAFAQHPEADMVTCGGRIVQAFSAGRGFAIKACYEDEKRLALTIRNICFDITAAICCRFIKKSLYERIGYFEVKDQQGLHVFSNDKAFLLRAYLHGAKNVFVPVIGHNYLAHPGSSTFGQNRQNIRRLCEEHMMMTEHFLTSGALSLPDRIQLHYWHMDQSTRLLIFRLLDGDLKAAAGVLTCALIRNPLLWPLALPTVMVRIVLKKILRGVKQIFSLRCIASLSHPREGGDPNEYL